MTTQLVKASKAVKGLSSAWKICKERWHAQIGETYQENTDRDEDSGQAALERAATTALQAAVPGGRFEPLETRR
jgi:hypothetical protein